MVVFFSSHSPRFSILQDTKTEISRSDRLSDLLSSMHVLVIITEELIGSEVTSMQVSRAAKELDEVLSAWRERQLSKTPYLILDARYEKVRHGGRVIDCAVLVAVGISASGHRSVLGCSVSLSEAETHWREFMNSLVGRGLSGVRMIISDDHAGLKADVLFFLQYHGSAVSFTYNKTHRLTCHSNR